MLYHSAAKLQNSLSSIVWNWTLWLTYTADFKRHWLNSKTFNYSLVLSNQEIG